MCIDLFKVERVPSSTKFRNQRSQPKASGAKTQHRTRVMRVMTRVPSAEEETFT